MTRARYRAFKCRQGVHRWHQRTEIDDGLFWKTCRDCRLSVSNTDAPIVDATTGISLRWVKQWDVQLDPMPSFVRYVVPEFAGRINADGSFTPAPTTDPMDPTGTLLRRRNVQIGPPGWH